MIRRICFLLSFAFCLGVLGVLPVSAQLFDRDDGVATSDDVASSQGAAEAMFQQAQGYEQGGKNRQARDLYRSIVKSHPRTLPAARAQFRYAVLLEADGDERKAFSEYKDLIKNFRNAPDFKEALARQYGIAERMKNSKKNGFLGIGATQPSTLIEMFELIADSAPHTEFAPKSLLNVGYIHTEEEDRNQALIAFTSVVNSYGGTSYASEAQYQIFKLRGMTAAESESPNADRAQVEAGLDFVAQNPEDARSQEIRGDLREIETRSMEKLYNTGRFYEKSNKPVSARLYYREVVKNPNTPWAAKAQERLRKLDNVSEPTEKSGGLFSRRKDEPEVPQAEVEELPVTAEPVAE